MKGLGTYLGDRRGPVHHTLDLPGRAGRNPLVETDLGRGRWVYRSVAASVEVWGVSVGGGVSVGVGDSVGVGVSGWLV